MILAAVEAGYYDLPRRNNLRQLAQLLRRSPATVSELIRKGERLIVLEFVRRVRDAPV